MSSIIGCDAANGTYYQLYSDDRGVCRVYEMSIGDSEWKLWRDGEPFPQRFTGRFDDDGRTIVGRWEKAEDGTNYPTDFDLTYSRLEQARDGIFDRPGTLFRCHVIASVSPSGARRCRTSRPYAVRAVTVAQSPTRKMSRTTAVRCRAQGALAGERFRREVEPVVVSVATEEARTLELIDPARHRLAL